MLNFGGVPNPLNIIPQQNQKNTYVFSHMVVSEFNGDESQGSIRDKSPWRRNS